MTGCINTFNNKIFDNKKFKKSNRYDNDKYIKEKVKIWAGSMISNFHNKKIPKEKVPCKCLSIIMLAFVSETDEKYCLQIFFEECKYLQKR